MAHAIQSFKRAETLASSLNDVESENFGNPLPSVGDSSSGEDDSATSQLFIRCRKRAIEHHDWDQVVAAWTALANLAWIQGHKGVAEKRYVRALQIAKAHEIAERKPAIALNLAQLLRQRGLYRRASP